MTEHASEPTIVQEPEGVRGRLVAGVTVLVVLATVVGITVAGWLLGVHERELRSAPLPASPENGKVGLELGDIGTTARGDRANRTAFEALERWRWVDRDAGVVAMPIDSAMDLVVEEFGRPPPERRPPIKRGTR